MKLVHDPLLHGAYATKSEKYLIENYLDNKITELEFDDKTTMKRPAFPEHNAKERCVHGF